MVERSGRWARAAACAGVLALASSIAACGGGGGAGEASSAASSTTPAGTTSPTDATGVSQRSLTSPSSSPSSSVPTSTTVRARTVVVLDPGHNGANGSHLAEIDRPVDAGGFEKPCNSTGAAEADLSEAAFTWDLAQLVKHQLEAAGVAVVLTRQSNDGWGPCIDERGELAARAGATALVSLHADGAAAGAHGFHVIHPTDIAGYTDETAGPSTVLATSLRDALLADAFTPATYIGTGDGLVARGDLGTLNRAGVPAAMVEVGNMHSSEDYSTMTSGEGKVRLADALTAGILRFAR